MIDTARLDREQARSDMHLNDHFQRIYQQTDRLFVGLMLFQWVAAIVAALVISPRAWAGTDYQVHLHVWAAIFLGGLITIFPVGLAVFQPGKTWTRHIIATGQMLMSALLIHLSGGRLETHFHVFGSLAFLAFYRDWRVLITATVVVTADHFLRGVFWSQSVFGTLTDNSWRWVEHAGWVVFEDIFLLRSCFQSLKEMRGIANTRAQLEGVNERIEQEVQERTAQLRSSEERFRSLADSSPVGIFQTDAMGQTLYINKKCQDILGLSEKEALGEGWVRVLHPDNREEVIREWADCVRRSEAFSREVNILTGQGEVRWTRCHSNVIRSEQGDVIGHVGTMEDITERRRMETVLRQADKMSAVGQLAAGVAHEINNPLGVILGFAQAVLYRLTPGDALLLPLQSIAREAVRCKNLVQDLLTFSRVSKMDREPIDFNQTIESALSLVMAQTKLAHVELRKELAPGLPRALANANQLQQVVVNLANNALDAIEGSGRLTIQTTFLNEGVHRWVILNVVDSGKGIHPDIMGHIFEPFFTTKVLGKGTGLGLSLIHEIVEKHSGMIDVQSRPGRTEFCVKIPAQDVAKLTVK